MQVGSHEWRELLIREAARQGILVDPLQAERMAVHARALSEWNRTINLTTITDPLEMAVKHFLDAILPLPHLPSGLPLLDMGTGAGFPGLALKIMRPAQEVTLLDASRKKISFLKQLLRELDLPQITAVQARAESLGKVPECRGSFGVIVCRALADLNTIARWAAPLLSSEGAVYVYQGPDSSRRKSGRDYELVASFDYTLPLLGDARTLAVIRPHL